MFDWIILDTSPVIPVSDATLVASSCDGILMVVRSNSTPSDLARRARENSPTSCCSELCLTEPHPESLHSRSTTMARP